MKYKIILIILSVIGSIYLLTPLETKYDFMLGRIYEHTVPFISSEELYEETGQNRILLDTRTQSEFDISHIPHSIFADYEKFNIDHWLWIPRDTEIILYCSVGLRSEKIGEEFINAGFTRVKNLYGGLFSWKNKGRIIVDSRNHVTEEIHAYNRFWGIWLSKGIKIYG